MTQIKKGYSYLFGFIGSLVITLLVKEVIHIGFQIKLMLNNRVVDYENDFFISDIIESLSVMLVISLFGFQLNWALCNFERLYKTDTIRLSDRHNSEGTLYLSDLLNSSAKDTSTERRHRIDSSSLNKDDTTDSIIILNVHVEESRSVGDDHRLS